MLIDFSKVQIILNLIPTYVFTIKYICINVSTAFPLWHIIVWSGKTSSLSREASSLADKDFLHI